MLSGGSYGQGQTLTHPTSNADIKRTNGKLVVSSSSSADKNTVVKLKGSRLGLFGKFGRKDKSTSKQPMLGDPEVNALLPDPLSLYRPPSPKKKSDYREPDETSKPLGRLDQKKKSDFSDDAWEFWVYNEPSLNITNSSDDSSSDISSSQSRPSSELVASKENPTQKKGQYFASSNSALSEQEYIPPQLLALELETRTKSQMTVPLEISMQSHSSNIQVARCENEVEDRDIAPFDEM